jgi:two-component system cell cycle sensor histidine kinase/response regulator CckA
MRLWRTRLHERAAETLAARTSLLGRLQHGRDGLAALLIDEAGGPALVIDAGGRIIRCNDAMRALLSPVALTNAASIKQVFAADSRHSAWLRIEQALSGQGQGPPEFTAALDRPAQRLDIRVALFPLREATGQISGALLRFADLTSQRTLEAQLAHSQKLQATGQLAGGIAHDFNNLLTAILGAAEGILEREQSLHPTGKSETAGDARQICESAHRGAALVRQLLAFGRQQTLQPRSLAVNDVIASISGLLQRLLGAKVRLVAELEQPGRRVMADPTQLDQVLVNLVVNARDAMPGGGEINLRSGHLTVYAPRSAGAETMPPGRYVTIEVQDRGTGIPPAVLPHIFDPFFTTKREAGGSGLGLSSVHGIIRQSDGFLTVETVQGAGTTMRIFLPRWDGPEPKPAPPPMEAAKPLPRAAETSRGIVLLADDEAPVRRLALRALTRAGWQVIEAESGESALESLQARAESAAPITALVSDMVMPGMSGLELATAVRIWCKCPELPVVFVSGYAESPVRGGMAQPGMIYLAKPYRLAELTETLERATQPAH